MIDLLAGMGPQRATSGVTSDKPRLVQLLGFVVVLVLLVVLLFFFFSASCFYCFFSTLYFSDFLDGFLGVF